MEEARQAFLQAGEASPGEIRAIVGLVDTLQAEGKQAEALVLSKEAVVRSLLLNLSPGTRANANARPVRR